MSISNPKNGLKVLLLGDSQVGKTAIFQRFSLNKFESSGLSTIGCDSKSKEIPLESGIVPVTLWDTSGQEKFKAITKNLFRGADGILLVYDITDDNTFKSINSWITDVKVNVSEKTRLILVGNKIDLNSYRKISIEQGTKLAKQYNISFLEISCKENINVNNLFIKIANEISEVKIMDEEIDSVILTNKSARQKGKCCSK